MNSREWPGQPAKTAIRLRLQAYQRSGSIVLGSRQQGLRQRTHACSSNTIASGWRWHRRGCSDQRTQQGATLEMPLNTTPPEEVTEALGESLMHGCVTLYNGRMARRQRLSARPLVIFLPTVLVSSQNLCRLRWPGLRSRVALWQGMRRFKGRI